MASEAPEKDPRAISKPEIRRSWATTGVAERQSIPTSPRGSGPAQSDWTPEQEKVIEELFALAKEGKLPRNRELKYWEPQVLSDRHLSMIVMRAGGVHQRLVAKAFGSDDAHVSIILNHPDAQTILNKIMTFKAAESSDIAKRLEALCDPAMSIIEDSLLSDDPEVLKVVMRKAPNAFKVLDYAGKTAPKKSEETKNINFKLDATPDQLSGIQRALREIHLLRNPEYVEVAQGQMMPLLPSNEIGGEVPRGEGAVGASDEEAAQNQQGEEIL